MTNSTTYQTPMRIVRVQGLFDLNSKLKGVNYYLDAKSQDLNAINQVKRAGAGRLPDRAGIYLKHLVDLSRINQNIGTLMMGMFQSETINGEGEDDLYSTAKRIRHAREKCEAMISHCKSMLRTIGGIEAHDMKKRALLDESSKIINALAESAEFSSMTHCWTYLFEGSQNVLPDGGVVVSKNSSKNTLGVNGEHVDMPTYNLYFVVTLRNALVSSNGTMASTLYGKERDNYNDLDQPTETVMKIGDLLSMEGMVPVPTTDENCYVNRAYPITADEYTLYFKITASEKSPADKFKTAIKVQVATMWGECQEIAPPNGSWRNVYSANDVVSIYSNELVKVRGMRPEMKQNQTKYSYSSNY